MAPEPFLQQFAEIHSYIALQTEIQVNISLISFSPTFSDIRA